MTFKLNRLYDNVQFRDVLVFVINSTLNTDGSVNVIGVWYNKGAGGVPYSMGVQARFVVRPNQFADWVLYNKCIRC